MTDSDAVLRSALRKGQESTEAGRVPDFEIVWASAESTANRKGRRNTALGGMAAAAALAGIVFVMQIRVDEQDWQFVDPDELASTTYWAAPSDILLPKHQIDLYAEIPVLIESTDSDGGALL